MVMNIRAGGAGPCLVPAPVRAPTHNGITNTVKTKEGVL